ncbi:MAG TPA: iron-sulfur cluster assembly accessory protein [Nitrososphaerales archaeon]|nr:iron-sulfur cluster assembly accessory protein [Nitrososphaerales archaeon]
MRNILICEVTITYDMQTTEKIVTITPLAIERVKEFMAKDKEKANGLRIFVQQGGCSGFQYGMVLEKNAKSDDLSWTENGINVYIDQQSAKLVEGAHIDFVDTVQGSGFKIDNPNAVSSCGCGCGGGSCGCGGHES